MKKLLLLLCMTQISFAQKEGYWDKERATTKEVVLTAGKRILLKTEALPIGTTEFLLPEFRKSRYGWTYRRLRRHCTGS